MKFKIVYLFSFFLTVFLVFSNQSNVYTNSGGPGPSKTGAPGENSCAQCHSNSGGGTGSVSISIEDNPTEYVAGTVYSITVEVTDATASEYGFQLTCLTGTSTSSDSPNTGGFSAGSGTELKSSGSLNRDYINHSTPSTTGSWTFNWTAPDPPEGDVHFYVAGNAVNGNNSTSGDKVYLNNLTLSAPAAACSITNLTATQQACDENGNFDVVINFNVSEAGANNTFTVMGNGTNYGTFNYNNLPITLTDLDGDNTTNYEFVVTDTNDANCTATTVLGVVDCPECIISNLVTTAQDCKTDGTFDVILDFNVSGAGASNTFTVNGNGTDYGTFNYNNLPITLTNLDGDNVTNYGFIVTDTEPFHLPRRCQLGIVNCPVCTISNLTATAQDCETDGTFDVVIDFDVEDAGGSTCSAYKATATLMAYSITAVYPSRSQICRAITAPIMNLLSQTIPQPLVPLQPT